MKIIELVYPNPPEVFIQRHVKALLHAGMDVHVVALNKVDYSVNKAASVQKLDSELSVIQAPIFPKMSVIEKIIAARYLIWPHTHIIGIAEKRIFSSFLEHLKPDLVHFQYANIAAAYYNVPEQLGIPYTISFRGSDVQVNPIVDLGYRQILTQSIEKSSGIHAVSDAIWTTAKNNLGLNFDERFVETIYTTVPISPLSAYPNEEVKTFVTIGRFHWSKAFVNLLLAFKKVVDRGPNYRLIIVGDGEDEVTLRYWVKALNLSEYVFFKGKLEYSEIADLLRHSSAYIQSSVAEGLCNATAEAMALGCPVFATNVGGTNEVILDSKNGILLDFAAPETWWEKLIRVNNRPLMEKFRESAWVKANDFFSSSLHAQRFKRFFEQSFQHFMKT